MRRVQVLQGGNLPCIHPENRGFLDATLYSVIFIQERHFGAREKGRAICLKSRQIRPFVQDGNDYAEGVVRRERPGRYRKIKKSQGNCFVVGVAAYSHTGVL